MEKNYIFTENIQMKSIIEKLSASLGQQSSDADIELALEISKTQNQDAVRELVSNLINKDKRIQSSCIKTLYETGYRSPGLISDYHQDFLGQLTSHNNRMVWGSMIALSTIADQRPAELFDSLQLILDTMKKGSVITVDAGVAILGSLNSFSKYSPEVEKHLTDILWKCEAKDLPGFMEKVLKSVSPANKEIYIRIINQRIIELEKESQKKRLMKILKTIEKL
jgi:hypothetical protein